MLDELREVAGDRLTLVPVTPALQLQREDEPRRACTRPGNDCVFLNDDVEVISEGWLEQLVAPLDEPDVGLTGAKLYFSDDTVQHAGHAYAAATTCTRSGTCRATPTGRSAPSSSTVRPAA